MVLDEARVVAAEGSACDVEVLGRAVIPAGHCAIAAVIAEPLECAAAVQARVDVRVSVSYSPSDHFRSNDRRGPARVEVNGGATAHGPAEEEEIVAQRAVEECGVATLVQRSSNLFVPEVVTVGRELAVPAGAVVGLETRWPIGAVARNACNARPGIHIAGSAHGSAQVELPILGERERDDAQEHRCAHLLVPEVGTVVVVSDDRGLLETVHGLHPNGGGSGIEINAVLHMHGGNEAAQR